MSTQRIILPGDGERATVDSDPTIVIEEGIREIVDTSLGDRDDNRMANVNKISETHDDWGGGFFVQPEPVLVQRGQDGSIVRTTPLSEIPGVHFTAQGFKPDDPSQQQLELEYENKVKTVEAKETPVPLSRSDRTKLVEILARRLYRYWRERGPNDPRYNPFRDGIPELPSGSPEHLQPLPGTDLYPATDGQIMDYARNFVGQRATVINRNRFGGGIEDLALRIE